MLVSACPRECRWLSVLVSDYDGFDCGKGRKISGFSPEMMVQPPDLPTYLIRFGPFVSMAALQNYRPNFGTIILYWNNFSLISAPGQQQSKKKQGGGGQQGKGGRGGGRGGGQNQGGRGRGRGRR